MTLEPVLDVLPVVAVVANGLLAGLFFAFTCAISPALGRLDDRVYVEAFRSINATILNGWFLTVFFAAPATAILAAALAAMSHRPSPTWLVVGALCSSSTFLVTVARNVPLNRALDTASLGTAEHHASARQAFETAWNRWNLVRTLTSIGALAAFAAASTGSS